MFRLLTCLLLLVSLNGSAQDFIGKTRAQAMKMMKKYVKKNDSLSVTLADQDSLLTYSVKGIRPLPVDFVFGFDRKGKCQFEKVVARCEECLSQYMTTLLNRKELGWKKINENQYVSDYEDHLTLELPPDNIHFSYTLLKADWNREMYNLLVGH